MIDLPLLEVYALLSALLVFDSLHTGVTWRTKMLLSPCVYNCVSAKGLTGLFIMLNVWKCSDFVTNRTVHSVWSLLLWFLQLVLTLMNNFIGANYVVWWHGYRDEFVVVCGCMCMCVCVCVCVCVCGTCLGVWVSGWTVAESMMESLL